MAGIDSAQYRGDLIEHVGKLFQFVDGPLFRCAGTGKLGQLAGFFDESLYRLQYFPYHGEAEHKGQYADADNEPEYHCCGFGSPGDAGFSQPVGDHGRQYARPGKNKRDDDVEADMKTRLFHRKNTNNELDSILIKPGMDRIYRVIKLVDWVRAVD